MEVNSSIDRETEKETQREIDREIDRSRKRQRERGESGRERTVIESHFGNIAFACTFKRLLFCTGN